MLQAARDASARAACQRAISVDELDAFGNRMIAQGAYYLILLPDQNRESYGRR